jgi:hypothetical protein
MQQKILCASFRIFASRIFLEQQTDAAIADDSSLDAKNKDGIVG